MKTLRPLIASFVLLTIITGVLYPLSVSGIGKLLFVDKVKGSLIIKDNKILGSRLIGQNFTDPKYFWGRPSATSTYAYNGTSSGGSNLGPTNPALKVAVGERIKALRDADPGNSAPVPVELVTASASGLDPHISPAAANFQLQRVARLRGLSVKQLRALLAQYTEAPQFGILGEARINVLELNLALDQLK
ncbi:MAG: potassium-transporting ATPase subunit KdpC [Burkholderiales bacterium]|nr:potassium-transporting ATPase subunit KdpC [Burkholderiales bacterium]